MVRFCKLRSKSRWRDYGVFEGKNTDCLRVYAENDNSIVVEANFSGASKPGPARFYKYIDPEIEKMRDGFYWMDKCHVDFIELEDNESGLFALRSDKDAF